MRPHLAVQEAIEECQAHPRAHLNVALHPCRVQQLAGARHAASASDPNSSSAGGTNADVTGAGASHLDPALDACTPGTAQAAAANAIELCSQSRATQADCVRRHGTCSGMLQRRQCSELRGTQRDEDV